jgi:hypothetical protein
MSATHPIAHPTEPGYYEAEAFPLRRGFVPVRIDDRGAAEVAEDGAYMIQTFSWYARNYGPFRQLSDDPTGPVPTSAPLIGLTGRKRSGKNTASALLVAEHGFEEEAFADPLRDMAAAIDPIVGYRAESRHDYGYGGDLVCTSDDVTPVYYSEALAEHGYEAAKELYPEFRRFLQRLGTEGVRDTLGGKYGLRELLGDDVWIVLAERRIDAADKSLVFTDVRFPNEADLIRRKGGEVVRISRAAVLDPADTHPSETAMDDYDVDDVLVNDGTLAHLDAKVDALVANKGATS